MYHKPDLEILFATSFSDSCFRSARAVAQLADRCRVSLTIAHVAQPGKVTMNTHHELNSFMAEADHYDRCRRVLLESDNPVKALAAECQKHSCDLIFAPASDRLGLHSLFTSSFRAGLLRSCQTPLWTAGATLQSVTARPGIQTIACLIDFDHMEHGYVNLAMSLARRAGAQFRMVYVVPSVDESTLAGSVSSNAPLSAEVTLQRIAAAFGDNARPQVDVVVGDVAQELPRLIKNCGADLLFVGPGHALAGAWKQKLAPHLDRIPCPVICADGASAYASRWTFETNASGSRAVTRYAGEQSDVLTAVGRRS